MHRAMHPRNMVVRMKDRTGAAAHNGRRAISGGEGGELLLSSWGRPVDDGPNTSQGGLYKQPVLLREPHKEKHQLIVYDILTEARRSNRQEA